MTFFPICIRRYEEISLVTYYQRAKKVVSDSRGLVDFAIGPVNYVFNLPMGKWPFLKNSNNRRTVKSILLVEKLLGLVEKTFGLVNASFILPKWQAVKMIFFAPCTIVTICKTHTFLPPLLFDATFQQTFWFLFWDSLLSLVVQEVCLNAF